MGPYQRRSTKKAIREHKNTGNASSIISLCSMHHIRRTYRSLRSDTCHLYPLTMFGHAGSPGLRYVLSRVDTSCDPLGETHMSETARWFAKLNAACVLLGQCIHMGGEVCIQYFVHRVLSSMMVSTPTSLRQWGTPGDFHSLCDRLPSYLDGVIVLHHQHKKAVEIRKHESWRIVPVWTAVQCAAVSKHVLMAIVPWDSTSRKIYVVRAGKRYKKRNTIHRHVNLVTLSRAALSVPFHEKKCRSTADTEDFEKESSEERSGEFHVTMNVSLSSHTISLVQALALNFSS